MGGYLTQQISFESRPSDPQSLLPGVPPLAFKRRRADYANVSSNVLNTYTLGEHISQKWGIGKALRRKPMMDPQTVANGVDDECIGLHKVLGTTVEVIVGGICHQSVRFLLPPVPPLRCCVLIRLFPSFQ